MVILISNTIAIALNETNDAINVIPNPSADKIKIIIDKYIGEVQYSMFDMTGKEVLLTMQNNEIDISYLKAGIYFLYIKTNDIIKVHKLVKQ